MRKQGLTFVFCLLLSLMFSFQAKADIEALQAVITALGDVYEGVQEQVTKVKSLYESGQQLAAQVKQVADEAQATVEKGKQMYESAREKAEAIKAKAQGVVDAIKNKDVDVLRSAANMEFASLKGTFDGTKDDDEMAEAVMDALVRKRGKDSISTQKALSKAINQKNGTDIANLFGQSIMFRQDLSREKDDIKNPTTVEEANDLTQKVQLRTMERMNRISAMEGGIARFQHTRAMENVTGSYEEGEKNE